MSNLIPFDVFQKKYSWPTESALRNYYLRKEKLGIQGAFYKLGGRVLIDPDEFFSLIKSQSRKNEERQKDNKKIREILTQEAQASGEYDIH